MLEDEKLRPENRALFKEYFDWQERKLKSINDLRELDKACYKTLCHYWRRKGPILEQRISNVFRWFTTSYFSTPYNGKNGFMQWNSRLVVCE